MNRLQPCFIALICGAGGLSAPVPQQPAPSTPYVKWTVKADNNRTAMNVALVVKELVVVGTENGELQAYRTADGKSIWTFEHGKRIAHRLSADDERVYFTAADGLVAVKAVDGKKVWSVEIDKGDGPVLAMKEKGVVYTADNYGTIYSFDAKTGKKLWTADFLADAPADPPGFDGERARLAPAKARPSDLDCDGETVFLTVFDQCRVVAFEASSGKRRWAFQTKGWVGGVQLTATSVFLGSQDTFLYCLDKKTGKEIWRFGAKNSTDNGCVADNQNVYFGTSAGNYYCLNQKDGKEVWRFKTDGRIDGRNYWTGSRPVLLKGTLWMTSHDGKLYGVAAVSGKRLCMLQPDEEADLSSPITDGNSFFLTTRPQVRTRGNSLVTISLK